MSLKSRFASQFNPKIRDRGLAYFRGGAVKILDHSDFNVLAQVKGTLDYFVELTLTLNSLEVACTCPYFSDGEDCKHIWAVMLAADSKNYLSDVDLHGPLRLVYDHEAVEALQLLEDDEPTPAPQPLWQQQLAAISSSIKNAQPAERNPWPDGREIYYIVDPQASRQSGLLNIDIAFRERNKKSEWSKIKRARIKQHQLGDLSDPDDREILSLLLGGKDPYWLSYSYGGYDLPNPFVLSNTLQPLLLPRMCATGRCMFRPEAKDAELKQLVWDDAITWQLWLVVKRIGDDYSLGPVLRNGSHEIDFSAAPLITEAVVIGPDFKIARFTSKGAREWSTALRTSSGLIVPATESRELIAQLMDLPSIPDLEVPPDLHFERVSFPPQPHLIVRKPAFSPYHTELEAKLAFDYEGVEVDYLDQRGGLYDRNRDRYIERDLDSENRQSLLDKVTLQGINKSKIQILEALLRLRQTACHPALVAGAPDGAAPNAKLDVLLPRLSEVTEEGHKAIVFSQFTSFLSIIRERLDHQGIEYEYLDGKTRRRGVVVERFQHDPNCKLFLISLKAGGQGLNLTAAEYVFLLDPWWNPAVEAQAIDRAHRIGQTNRVFAYRLITRDTVEEKVLELQSTKRDLADAIINADNSVIRNITGEDLRMLLS